MMVKMEGIFRRWMAAARGLASRDPVRRGLRLLAWFLAGGSASAACLRGYPIPLVPGLLLNCGPSPGLAAVVGAWAGYRFFWGEAGITGLWWTAAGALLCLRPLPQKFRPGLGCLAAAVGELGLRLGGGSPTPWDILLLRLALGAGVSWLAGRRDRVSRWLGCGCAVLALSQIAPVPGFSLGPAAAAALAAGASFPAAALGALGVDLARITPVPVGAVVILAWLGRLLPLGKKRLWLLPAGAGLLVMAATGQPDWRLLPGLLLGGGLGRLLPRAGNVQPRQGPTGAAQVRLEMAAAVMGEYRRALMEMPPPAIDREALLQRLRSRTCAHCPARRDCLEQKRLTVTALEDSRRFTCRKSSRVRWELGRAREQLRLLRAEHRRREEYRQAMAEQYLCLKDWLQSLSDALPREEPHPRCRYRLTLGIRTRGSGSTNGDGWAAFPGSGGRYYVVLCDGMGTGPGAREESRRALALLRRQLRAGIPAERALGSLNDLLVLTGRGGAVAVDLAELRLDSGQARLYKWGAAPSWRFSRGTAEKIGTAVPPPGFSVTQKRPWVGRLSLRQGEMLILISDGVDGEEVPRRVYNAPDAPPGELAERLLEGIPGRRPDDATAAVIRLSPGNLATS